MKAKPTKDTVICPEKGCNGLCYWSVHDDPQELRCVECGSLVEKRKNGDENGPMS
jgi:hypothetical protein